MIEKESLELLNDARAQQVLERLYAEASGEFPGLILRMLPYLPSMALGRKLRWEGMEQRLSSKFMPLDQSQGLFSYLLARSIGARRIIEYGTSFGVSTIYLALAVRHNGGGTVIGTELVPEKAARARQHLEQAGLADLVEVRVGDAAETLSEIEGPVDFLLNDGFPPKALPVLQCIAPHMRKGAVVVTDNVGLFKADYAAYIAYLRDPVNGFRSSWIGMAEGMEFSVREG